MSEITESTESELYRLILGLQSKTSELLFSYGNCYIIFKNFEKILKKLDLFFAAFKTHAAELQHTEQTVLNIIDYFKQKVHGPLDKFISDLD